MQQHKRKHPLSSTASSTLASPQAKISGTPITLNKLDMPAMKSAKPNVKKLAKTELEIPHLGNLIHNPTAGGNCTLVLNAARTRFSIDHALSQVAQAATHQEPSQDSFIQMMMLQMREDREACQERAINREIKSQENKRRREAEHQEDHQMMMVMMSALAGCPLSLTSMNRQDWREQEQDYREQEQDYHEQE